MELIEIKKHLLGGVRSTDKERGKGVENLKGRAIGVVLNI